MIAKSALSAVKLSVKMKRNHEYIPVLTIFSPSEFKVNSQPPGVRDDFPGFYQIPGSAKNPGLVPCASAEQSCPHG